MTQVGKRITVAASVVTDIRIDPRSGTLTIEGVDQDKDKNTLRAHTITYDLTEGDAPAPVLKGLDLIRTFAQGVIDEA